MLNENVEHKICPIAQSLSVLGDAWSMLILRDAHVGYTRFDQFRKSLSIAPTILTKRLASLVNAGLLEKSRYSVHPPREEYILTRAGKDFLPVLFVLGDWGRKYNPSENPDQMTTFFDVENGTEIKPIVIDEVTGGKIGSRAIRAGD
ncbi:MAG: helix-turn-helix domain-containing protein [Acinetobacter sp.]